MAGYVIKRLVWAAMLMVIISFVTFVIFFVIPGETRVQRASGTSATSLGEVYDIQGRPLPEEYALFLWAVVRHGDLGKSFINHEPVTDKLAQAAPVTISLLVGGALFFVALAFPIGILSALRPRSVLDRVSMVFVLIGVSAHPVWIGLMLSYGLGVKLHWMPIAGYCDFFNPSGNCGGAAQWAYHLLLPWLTFAFLFAALYARMIRATIVENLNEDYVRTAQAKGAGSWRVLRVHVLRNALLPVVTMLGMDLAVAFGGALFIETVYGLPGIGKMLVGALTRRDLPVIMGIVLVVSVAVALATALVDFLYSWLDPRVRLSSAPRPRAVAQPPSRVRVRADVKVTGSTG